MEPQPPQPDMQRVILHFDVDCMYAQTEELRNPALAGRPLAVTQKYLIVTCNYPARAAGVTKLMATAEGLKKCPGLVLVSGEDLTPYRKASQAIQAVLRRFGPTERLGMDEAFVDATAEVEARLAAWGGRLPPGLSWCGHLQSGSAALVADSRHRPQDLRAPPGQRPVGVEAPSSATPAEQLIVAGHSNSSRDGGETFRAAAAAEGGATAGGAAAAAVVQQPDWAFGDGGGADRDPPWVKRLMVGSAIAREARAAVRAETGFRSSAGVACNKLLAKLVSGVHKPDDQTILPPPEAWAFLSPLPVRALTGVGYKLAQQLAELGVGTVSELRRVPLQRLVAALGDTLGPTVHGLCRGLDPSPVRPTGPPKSITVEDSFAGCNSWDAVLRVLRVLAPDLLARVHEEWAERRRRPATLTVKWRAKGAGWHRTSASVRMPLAGPLVSPPGPAEAEAVERAALALLKQQPTLTGPGGFNLSLINIGVSNFKEEGPGGGGRFDTGAFARLFGGNGGAAAVGAAAGGSQPAAARAAGPDSSLIAEVGGDPSLPAWARELAAGGAAVAAAVPAALQAAPLAAAARQAEGPLGIKAAAAVAAAASAQRRDYRTSPRGGTGAALSKSDERRLREQGFQQQQVQMDRQPVAPWATPAATWQQPQPQQPQQQPPQSQQQLQQQQHQQHQQQQQQQQHERGPLVSDLPPHSRRGTGEEPPPNPRPSKQPRRCSDEETIAPDAAGSVHAGPPVLPPTSPAAGGAFDVVSIGGCVVGSLEVVEGDWEEGEEED